LEQNSVTLRLLLKTYFLFLHNSAQGKDSQDEIQRESRYKPPGGSFGVKRTLRCRGTTFRLVNSYDSRGLTNESRYQLRKR
jgi:hypothetical protein